MTARILGTGIRSPLGDNLEDVWDGLLGGVRSASVHTFGYVDQERSFVVCKVTSDVTERYTYAERRRMDRLHLLGVTAALDACDAAGVPMSGPRVAVVAGVGLPPPETVESQFELTLTKPRRVSPLAIPLTMVNGLAADIARRLDATGPCQTVSTACASGADALGLGMLLLNSHAVDRVVVVGADAPLTASVLYLFDRSSALTGRTEAPEKASQPFGTERDGFVIAEGAAAVVLERGARGVSSPLGSFAGYAASNDAYHLTAPHPSGRGALAATSAALRMAGIASTDVVSVNSHGTSTPLNDDVEARVIARLFGPAVPVTATKAATGHMIGGSGVLEALVAAKSATAGLVPPVGDYPIQEDLGISVVVRMPASTGPGPVVSNSFGFGGQNTVLVAVP